VLYSEWNIPRGFRPRFLRKHPPLRIKSRWENINFIYNKHFYLLVARPRQHERMRSKEKFYRNYVADHVIFSETCFQLHVTARFHHWNSYDKSYILSLIVPRRIFVSTNYSDKSINKFFFLSTYFLAKFINVRIIGNYCFSLVVGKFLLSSTMLVTNFNRDRLYGQH